MNESLQNELDKIMSFLDEALEFTENGEGYAYEDYFDHLLRTVERTSTKLQRIIQQYKDKENE